MDLNKLANEIINRRGYLVISTSEDFSTLPFSLSRGECNSTEHGQLDSSCLYAYERTDRADFMAQSEMQTSMGITPMLVPEGCDIYFYRVRGD